MRTILQRAVDISAIGTFILTIIIVVLMVMPMVWPSQPTQSVITSAGKPVIGWVMPSILAACILLAGALNFLAARERRKPSPVHPPALQRMTILPASPPPVLPVPIATLEERIFVGPDITPQFLGSLLKDHTDIQARRLLDVYVGKWIKISGTVHDVSKLTDEVSMVSFASHASPTIIMLFDKKWLAQLSILRRGNNIVVVGAIEDIDQIRLKLRACELV